MEMNIILLMSFLPVVFMIHDFEEIIMFKPWLSKNREELELRFPKFERFLAKRNYFHYSTSAFSMAVLHEFLIITLVTTLSLWFRAYNWWFAAFSAYFLHLFVHIIQWIIYKKYVPVIITSFFTLPYCIYTLYVFVQSKFLATNTMIIWMLIGVVLTVFSFPSAFYFASKFENWKITKYYKTNKTK